MKPKLFHALRIGVLGVMGLHCQPRPRANHTGQEHITPFHRDQKLQCDTKRSARDSSC
jgi:hypothetical protein